MERAIHNTITNSYTASICYFNSNSSKTIKPAPIKYIQITHQIVNKLSEADYQYAIPTNYASRPGMPRHRTPHAHRK